MTQRCYDPDNCTAYTILCSIQCYVLNLKYIQKLHSDSLAFKKLNLVGLSGVVPGAPSPNHRLWQVTAWLDGPGAPSRGAWATPGPLVQASLSWAFTPLPLKLMMSAFFILTLCTCAFAGPLPQDAGHGVKHVDLMRS